MLSRLVAVGLVVSETQTLLADSNNNDNNPTDTGSKTCDCAFQAFFL